jgi:hypothetical protein
MSLWNILYIINEFISFKNVKYRRYIMQIIYIYNACIQEINFIPEEI